MLISIILISHIILAIIVSSGFIYRYMVAYKSKSYPKTGRTGLMISSILLVLSGASLTIIGKLSISSICFASIVLVGTIVLLEFGVIGLSRLQTQKIKN